MSNLKNQILNLFLDNVSGDITASDIRVFVNAVFDSKENVIRKYKRLSDIKKVAPNTILVNDLITIYTKNDPYDENGIYLVQATNPNIKDLELLSSIGFEVEDLLLGALPNQILSVQNGELTWIDQPIGYMIQGTKSIVDILDLIQMNIGDIWIASSTDLISYVPGFTGDGYIWTGKIWNNVGQLIGPEGPVGPEGPEGPEGPKGPKGDYTLTSELQKIDYGNKIGWKLLSESTLNHGELGSDAIDLSMSSVLEGSLAGGENSFIIGEETKTTESHSFVTGKYNKQEAGAKLIVGTGSDNNNRENSFEVYEDGRVRAPKLTIQQQEEEHSFVTRRFINQMTIDGGPLIIL